MATTLAHKDSLLLTLKFPELPLHNNSAELGARGQVRKRNVSFRPRTEEGKQARDTFMTLAATTKKLKVRFYENVRDRILKKNMIPPLSELIHNATHELLRTQSFSLTDPLIIEMIPAKLAKNAKKPLNLCELRALRGGVGSFARIHV